jgi:hypothetical protein
MVRVVLLESPPWSEPGADATRPKKLSRRSGALVDPLLVVGRPTSFDVVSTTTRLAHHVDVLRELADLQVGVLLDDRAHAHVDGLALRPLKPLKEKLTW